MDKHSSILLFLFFVLFLPQHTIAQKDTTINIKTFKIIAAKIPKGYKTTNFDSSTISNSTNLAQLLSENSTVFIKTYGSGSLATVSFRGTGASHTKVQWNGVNLNSPMNGQIDFSLYPTFFFDAAELHHGASGLIDGNGALGGSVIMLNTEAYNKGFSTAATQSVGSFGNYITTLKGSYSTKKWFSETKIYRNNSNNDFDFINNSKIDNPTETQVNAELTQYGIQQAVYRKFKNSSVGARVWYFNSDRKLPRTMLVAENDENQTDKSFRALLEWKGLHKKLQYKLSSALVKDELVYENTLANIYSENNSYLFDNKLNTKIYLNNNLTIINDINIKHETAKADGFSEEHSRINSSWLIGISKNFKRLNINLYNRFIAVGNNTEFLAPTLGFQYQLLKKEHFFVKANAGINYNYPTFNDLFWNPGGNPSLKPEQAKMSEISLNYSKTAKSITFNTEITVFYSEVDNWIIWQPTQFGFWSPSNLRQVENKGLEGSLSISKNINAVKIKTKINYAYTKSTNQKAQSEFDNSKNKQLIYVPFHKLNFSLNAAYKKISINYSYNYTGKRFTATDNNWFLPANFLHNFSLSKQFKTSNKANIIASFKVNNLLNQAYQSIAWRAIPGRNYLLTIGFNFN